MEVFGSVLIFRIIAAAHVTALQAEPEMYPGVASRNTLFTNMGVGVGNLNLL
jgi:hypothetical protein